ncbi:MAG TPA: hypothetical protein VF099_07120 [Ktedonobacterales bacterium]
MNPLTLFQRAQQYQPLAPHQRALLKFFQGLLITAGVAALTAVAQLILNKGVVTWQEIWKAAAVAAIIAIANALIKYFTAKGDPELANVVKPAEAAVVGQVEQAG